MDSYYTTRRVHNQDISGQAVVNATGSTATFVTARSANHSIYVQRIIAYVTTGAAVNWSFGDATGAKTIAVVTSPASNTRWEFDFGPIGVPVTTTFGNVISATGAAGTIEYYGYQRLTAAVAPAQTN